MKRALDFTKGSEELPPAKVFCQRDLYCDSMASSSSFFPSSFPISSTSQWKYEVFLSFRGEDTRNTLVDFLSYALHRRGIYFFKDDEKLEGGKTIKPELLKAIEESRFAVVILSENYASSTWCLEELVKIVDCEKEMGMTILPIFYNVDPSDVRKQTGTFAKAFEEHEKQFKEKVGTWRDALNHVAGISGHHLKNSPLSEAVKWIVEQLSHKSSYEFSEITEGLVGIRSRLVELESCLALWVKDDVRTIGFWAMGGMGKSTLANVAYRMLSKEFDDHCFIDDVRNKDLFSLQKDLISQISGEANSNIRNKIDGENMIKKMLLRKKVLLVLDDVDESNKLKKLVKSDWFGLGSRIIITTRDMSLLNEFSVDEIFEVKALNYEDALCLFCSKAFKKKQCPDEYLELSKRFLEYGDGLPLALEVLGSFLFEKSTAEWKSALEMLKEGLEPKINQVLEISFKELSDSVKDIFKDIACFFNHEERDHAVRMLDSFRPASNFGLSILMDKSLLKISDNNELWMHNLIEDMGRNMVRQESPEPGERSRLFDYKDIVHVFKNNMGTKKVQAIDIKGAKDTSIYHEEKEARWRPQGFAPLVILQEWVLSTLSWLGFTSSEKQKWHPNAFLNMPNVKFLRICNISLQLDTLPNNLIYFEYNDYPFKSLPPLPDELVELHLPRSKIKLLWGGMKIFENLKSINMDGSLKLIVAPDFDGVPNLEELVLSRCSSLCKLHPSIGKLKKLKLLDLEECQELTSLPDKFEMESLVTLNLSHCLKVKKIPEFVGNMELFQQLLLKGTAIIELPSSVECLTGLNTLILQNCKNLVCLPNIICSLTSLNNLNLFGCSKFDKLPKELGNIISLKKLDLSGTAIKELPSSIESLIGLKELALEDCKKFVLLPSTICSLKSLEEMHVSRCPKFVNLPENFGNIKHLERLSFEGTAIEELPSSVGRLAALYYFNLKDCKNLVCLPNTICNLKSLWHFDLTGCSKITNLPENLGNMERLLHLYLGGTAIKELSSSTIHRKRLTTVSFKGCQLSSSSLTFMPGSYFIDLSDCNLSAFPSGIDRFSEISDLFLRGNDFVSLPESISQLSGLRLLYLDGCKSLRSLSNSRIPSKVEFICVDNCTSLEILPEPPNDLYGSSDHNFKVQCFNCFELAYNIQNYSNMFQGQQFEICYIIPGREIPKWFETVNICDTSVVPLYHMESTTYKIIKKVKIQLPGSGSGCDEWRGIVFCVVFLLTEPHHRFQLDRHIRVNGLQTRVKWCGTRSPSHFTSEYGKVESHHLWLQSVPKNEFHPSKTPGCSIDEKGFHQVELEIETEGLEVEKIGFRML